MATALNDRCYLLYGWLKKIDKHYNVLSAKCNILLLIMCKDGQVMFHNVPCAINKQPTTAPGCYWG